jgi:hypothetical protein
MCIREFFSFAGGVAVAIGSVAGWVTQVDDTARRDGPRPQSRQPRDPPPPDPLMMLFDANQDGTIDAEEIRGAPAALLKLDRNQDGSLSRDELPQPPRPPQDRPRDGRPGNGRPGNGRPGAPSADRPRGERPDQPPPRDRVDADPDHGRPVELIARDLGVTPEAFREAFKRVRPAPRGERPTHEQREQNRRVLSEALGVAPEKLDEVMDRYRPEGPAH